MLIAKIKGLKISQVDERVNLTGNEMIPFLDGDKNGRIRMSDFKGMALHVVDPSSFSDSSYEELLLAINANKVIFIPNRDKTGLKVVTEISTSNNGNSIHLESPDYTTDSNGTITKVWFDVVDITKSPLKVNRSVKESVEVKATGSKTKVLAENGTYIDITDLALTEIKFKDGTNTSVYDLNSDGITFLAKDTAAVHWETKKSGNDLTMSLKIDKATLTQDGLMSKEDKYKLDVTVPAELARLDKRADKLRHSIRETNARLDEEIETRQEQFENLSTRLNTETEQREHGDKELRSLLNAEVLLRESGDKRIESRLNTEVKNLDTKFTQVTLDTNSKLDLEILERKTADSNQTAALNAFTSTKGQPNGLAELDSSGKVPASLLPGYVDDVLEFPNKSQFPTTGESGKIYVATDDNKTYRWSGNQYVVISETLALGETASTAYPGDKGKANREALNSLPNLIVTDLDHTDYTGELVKVKYKKVTKNGLNYGNEQIGEIDIKSATIDEGGIMSATDKLHLDKLYDGLGTVDLHDLVNKTSSIPEDIVTSVANATLSSTDVIFNYNATHRNPDLSYPASTPRTATIPAATTAKAGVMTAADYNYLHTGLPGEVKAEADRAKAAENTLLDNIDNEKSARETKDAELDKNIAAASSAVTTEKNRAEAEEKRLEGLITAEKDRAEKAEGKLLDAITLETHDRTTIDDQLKAKDTAQDKEIESLKLKDTELQNKDTSQDTEIQKLKDKDTAHDKKDTEHDNKLKELETKITEVSNNPITVLVTGSGNAITTGSVTGKLLMLTKGDTFVNISSPQNISSIKTFVAPAADQGDYKGLINGTRIMFRHIDGGIMPAGGNHDLFLLYYNNDGHVIIGASNNTTDKLHVDGSVSITGLLKSTLAQGTSPFSVISNTVVTNLNSDLLDGHHEDFFVNRYAVKVNQHNNGNYMKIMLFRIPTGTLGASISFIWHPNECNLGLWADFNINFRDSSIKFSVDWKGDELKNFWCVGDGTTYSVWAQCIKTNYDPYGLILIINVHQISDLQVGVLGFSDSEPTGVYKQYALPRGIAWRTFNKLNINAGKFSGAAVVFDGSANLSINIPTKASHLENDSGFWTGTKYWANVAVSSTSSTTTNPTFHSISCSNETINGSTTDFASHPWLMLHIPNKTWTRIIMSDDGTVHFLHGNYAAFNGSSEYNKIKAGAFIKSGGTAAQFLKADGSVSTLTATATSGATAGVNFNSSTGAFTFTLPKGDKGDTGPAGPLGPKGATGPKGDTGPAGPTGARGPAGANGANGKDGKNGTVVTIIDGYWAFDGVKSSYPTTGQGTVGPQGPAGPTGPQGPKGPKGDKGDPGTNGTNGTNGVTPTIKCASGTHINTPGTASVNMTSSGTTYTFTFDYLKGAKGDKGDTGAKGATGDSQWSRSNNKIYPTNSSDSVYCQNGFFKASATSSDIRLKSDIKSLNHSLDEILSIPTLSFVMDGEHRIGTTAQDLERLGFNELVTTTAVPVELLSDTSKFDVYEKDGAKVADVKYVNYAELSILALEAVKMLKAEIDELKALKGL